MVRGEKSIVQIFKFVRLLKFRKETRVSYKADERILTLTSRGSAVMGS